MTMVSVISVCFNEDPAKVCTTIESILMQDYPSLELIVIDGGSDAETLQAFDRYRSRIAYFVSEPDNGIFDAMNKGLAVAQGDWICFMNIGDSFAAATALSNLINERTLAADIVYGDPVRPHEGRARSPARISKYLLYYSAICHQAMVARRSLFSRIGNFDATLKLGGDPEWLLRAHRGKAAFMYIPTVVCHYEDGGASADYRERKRYRAIVTQRHFAVSERIVYGTMLFVQKCARRLTTLNFRVPISVREWIARKS